MDISWVRELSGAGRGVLRERIERHLSYDHLQDYRAYAPVWKFHAASRKWRHRLLHAGNKFGKTEGGAAEAAMHLTGEYPQWWRGRRFEHPITLWATGETADSVRDIGQEKLFGGIGQWGTGYIPMRTLTRMRGMSQGASNLVDYWMIRHVSGGLSMYRSRYYSQGRQAWQGADVHVLWFDEEPPADIYDEGIARTRAVNGITYMTFTPVFGWTPVVNLYLRDEERETAGRYAVRMRIHDALHIGPERIAEIIAATPEHMRQPRIEGLPGLGEGAIYPFSPRAVTVEPFAIPRHFRVLGGIDFGGASTLENAHPTAAVKLAQDPDSGVIYVTREYREQAMRPVEHWLSLRHWGADLVWAWPRDGMHTEKGTGEQLVELYRKEGMKTLAFHAHYPETLQVKGITGRRRTSVISVERGIAEIGGMLQEGRLKIFSSCSRILDEMQSYHRKKGQIEKWNDDLLDAMRYGVMMMRFAEAKVEERVERPRHIDWRVGA